MVIYPGYVYLYSFIVSELIKIPWCFWETWTLITYKVN